MSGVLGVCGIRLYFPLNVSDSTLDRVHLLRHQTDLDAKLNSTRDRGDEARQGGDRLRVPLHVFTVGLRS